MNKKLDLYFSPTRKWHEEFSALRAIILECGLDEEMKWGQACYTKGGKNVVLIHGFREYCAMLFFKGTLLPDPKKILVRQTANVQAPRQIRFTDVKQIIKTKTTLKAYVKEAINVELSGKKVEWRKPTDLAMPAEFKEKLNKLPALKKAFNQLTPGRQKAYILYFGSAKQEKTREARVEKWIPQILKGKGMDD